MAEYINGQFPLSDLHSLDELMDIAVGIEREAALRYDQLSTLMARRGDSALAATFEALAAIERAHEAGLMSWVRRLDEAEPVPKQFLWQLPETFSLDDVDAAPLSPYQALGIAVRNEERAFVFYTYVAAQAHARPDLRERAEALAKEELAHVAHLRRLRRLAFHAARGERSAVTPLPATLSALYHVAWELERRAADLAATAARCLAGQSGQDTKVRLITWVAEDAGRRAEAMARQALEPGGVGPGKMDSRAPVPPMPPEQALALCERDTQEGLEVYLSIAERVQDDALLHAAQDLAETAMARLAFLRGGHLETER
ncbi:MAG TPA: ferritin family protein [Patescibacteria group bacterium]|nr:ferritin family protein [Patescibacteria group bacterium]